MRYGIVFGLWLALAGCDSASDETKAAPAVPWGTAAGQVGRVVPDEGAPEAARSFAVDESGTAYLLDRVNRRVQVVRGGKVSQSIALPERPFEDIELTQDGFALLDPFVSRSVVLTTRDGSVVSERQLEPLGVSANRVTALSVEASGIWVEVDGSYRVRVADAAGKPAEIEANPGTLVIGDQVYGLDGSPAGALTLSRRPKSGGAKTALGELALGASAVEWRLLGNPDGTRLYVAARHAKSSEPSAAETILLVTLDANGKELARREIAGSSSVEESFRWVKLGADGKLHFLTVSASGVTLREVKP